MLKSSDWILVVIAIAVAFCSVSLHLYSSLQPKQPVFINTSKVLPEMPVMVAANRSIEEHERSWKDELKRKDDSLTQLVDSMSKVFNESGPVVQSRLKNELDLLNMESNVIRHQGIEKTTAYTKQVMDHALQQGTKMIENFALKHHYPLVFGTPVGVVLYGSDSKADVSKEFVHFIKVETYEK